MKPFIAILPNVNDDGIISVDQAYVRAIEKSGGVPFVVPCLQNDELIRESLSRADGVLITGGADVDPNYYGEAPSPFTQPPCVARDVFDFAALKIALELEKPIFAICRGFQLLNVALGGTLYQDLPTQYESKLSHKQSQGKFEPSHSVILVETSPLYRLVGKKEIVCNSFHHQAIKRLADGLFVAARAEDGVIEAVYGCGKTYLRGVQWHPERLFERDADNRKLFEEFIEVCGK